MGCLLSQISPKKFLLDELLLQSYFLRQFGRKKSPLRFQGRLTLGPMLLCCPLRYPLTND
jgi:hypothetical protein